MQNLHVSIYLIYNSEKSDQLQNVVTARDISLLELGIIDSNRFGRRFDSAELIESNSRPVRFVWPNTTIRPTLQSRCQQRVPVA